MPLQRELERVVPVVEALARRTAVPLSVDTSKAEVAAAALDAGAQIVNDVSGLSDLRLASLVASRDTALIVMHTRGTPLDMQSRAVYGDLHGEVLAELESMLERAKGAGIAEEAKSNVGAARS